jgi:hypothetical protein
MSGDNLGYLPLLLGGLSIGYALHAVATGANVMSSVRLDRATKPKMFWIVTGLETVLGLALGRLGAEMLGWI